MPYYHKVSEVVKIEDFEALRILDKVLSVEDYRKAIKLSFHKSITFLSEIILGGAIKLRASDIHIEPKETDALLRVRIDGILQEVLAFPKSLYHSLVSRIKFLAKLKLNITDRPQDGRFTISFEGIEIEVRTSDIPAEYGETIVMRLLDPRSLLNLEELGLRKDLLEIFKREIRKPNGMIILTGPTGSGKTTTLYAILTELKSPEIKIITIEDPIEYHLEGVVQTQVDPKRGYDFANGLRAIVRQDPDVILVGEIRDLETAQIALQAALTGHLVLTTLHTNDSAGTVARLQALGEKPVNIAPALNMAVAQRLVRRVCKKCSKLKDPEEIELKKIKKVISDLPPSFPKPDLKNLKLKKPKGCKECNHTGYRGRIGIFEAFLVDEEIEQLILTSPPINVLRETAKKKGMVTLQQDGILKVLEKITTIEEVERITGPIEI